MSQDEKFDVSMAGINTHDIVERLLDAPDGGLVIDAGTGQGAMASRLIRKGYDVLAYGIDETQYIASAPFRRVDLDREDLADEAPEGVSAVVAIEIIEHLESPLLFMRQASEALRPDGYLILTTPNVLSVAAKMAYNLRGTPVQFGRLEYETNGHISPVTLPTIKRMAERVGLSIEVVTYNVGKLPIPKIRHRYPLRGARWRNEQFGESLIVKLRKTGSSVAFERG